MAATLEQGCVFESSLPLIPNDTIVSKVAHINCAPKITNEDWQKEQADDPHISRVLELMKQDKLLSYKSARNDPSGLRVYLTFWKDLVLKNKLRYRKVKLKGHDTSIFQFVPYRPETNGTCECFNSTLINMLGTLPVESKKEWQDWVSTMTHAYNCTISHATGYKPYYLMYGCEPRLAIDVEYGVTMPTLTNNIRHNYVKKLQARLKLAFVNARDFNQKEMSHCPPICLCWLLGRKEKKFLSALTVCLYSVSHVVHP